jgi:hypothetical protein
MNRLEFGSALLLALTGCGSGPIAGDDEGGDASETSAADTTDGGTDGLDTDTDSDATDTDTGTPECPSQQPVTARFTVTPDVESTATCAVVSEASDGRGHYEMQLDCAGTDVTVVIDSTIPRMPSPGATVEFDYRRYGQDYHWLAIHDVDQQTLVLGGVNGLSLDPPGTTLAEFFGDPVLSVADEQKCGTTREWCGEMQRLGLDVEIEGFGPFDPVFDRGSWYADFLAFGYAIEVEVATRIEPYRCVDGPAQRYELLVVWFPSD